jgi:hypothetical protein
MVEKITKQDIDSMSLNLGSMIRSSGATLDNAVREIGREFPGLNPRDLPEYKQAMDAIRAYELAVMNHFIVREKKRYSLED